MGKHFEIQTVFTIHSVRHPIPDETVQSPLFPPANTQPITVTTTTTTTTTTMVETPQGPPPAYTATPFAGIHHAILQKQLLMNPQFAQANANNNAGKDLST